MRPELDTLIVPALRELACILLLARFKVHTEDTLSMLEAHIERYSEATAVCILDFIIPLLIVHR